MTVVETTQSPSCFIIMPISTPPQLVEQYGGDEAHFDHVLEHLFVKAVRQAGFEPIRPSALGSEVIHSRIVQQLQDAEMVLCDLSSLNPNVLFELGIRVSVNKPMCIVRDEFTHLERVFDLHVVNSLSYSSRLNTWEIEDQTLALANHLGDSATASSGRNPLWEAFSIRSAARLESADSPFESTVLSDLSTITAAMETLKMAGGQLGDALSPGLDRHFIRSQLPLFELVARGIVPMGRFRTYPGRVLTLVSTEALTLEQQQALESAARNFGFRFAGVQVVPFLG